MVTAKSSLEVAKVIDISKFFLGDSHSNCNLALSTVSGMAEVGIVIDANGNLL